MGESSPPVEETKLQRMAFVPAFRSGARLEWTDASGLHSVLVEGKTLVGSAASAGIVVQDPAVSRLHLELEPRSDGVWVRDLNSRNGTFLEGVQVLGARVPQGGRLVLGTTEIRVEYRPDRTPVELWPQSRFGRLIGSAAVMRELFAILSRVAPLDSPVLVHGETGTGKELVAQAIHEASPRADKPFVVVDCAALPENLLDAELFGHTKGAFTGAVGARLGAIEAAEGGTVFLDEIGELPMSMQPKLLRALESRSVRRVGETSHRKVDVRFIAATHRDLLTMVNEGEFREDLYFRLSVLPIVVPPLRARRDDIPELVDHFWRERGGDSRLSPEMLRELVARHWRGNVRELRNFVERARALGANEALALGRSAEERAAGAPSSPMSVALPVVHEPLSSEDSLEEVREMLFARTFKEFREAWIDRGEREYVQALLDRNERNVAAAAKEAGVDRTYLYRLIRKHDL